MNDHLPLKVLAQALEMDLGQARAAMVFGCSGKRLPENIEEHIDIETATQLAFWHLLMRMGLPPQSQYAVLGVVHERVGQFARDYLEGVSLTRLIVQLIDNTLVAYNGCNSLYDYTVMQWTTESPGEPVFVIGISVKGIIDRSIKPLLAS